MRSAAGPAWVLPLLAGACFAIALGNEPIGDDAPLLRRLEGVGPGQLPELFRQNYWGALHSVGLYRPASLSLIAAQRWLFGTDTLIGFHLVSLGLHAGCTWLVFRVLSHFVDDATAWLAAALFAVHPIHAEAVVTVYGQCDLLATLFSLLALERALAVQRLGNGAGRLILALLFYLLALLAKEAAIVAPLLCAWVLGSTCRRERRGIARWVGGVEIGFVLVTLVYLGLRLAVLGRLLVPGEASVMEGAGGLGVPVVTLGTYLKLLVAPVGQTIYYGHLRDALSGGAWPAALWAFAGLVLLLVAVTRRPGGAVTIAGGWIAIALLPIVNAIPIGIIAAERALYLPSVGFALLTSIAIETLARRLGKRELGALLAATLVIVYLGLSARVAWRWRDPHSLWQSTIEAHPTSPKAHAAYGMEILNLARGRGPREIEDGMRRAEREFRRALELNARSADARMGLGIIGLMEGDCSKALAELRRAEALRPGDRTVADLMSACRGPRPGIDGRRDPPDGGEASAASP